MQLWIESSPGGTPTAPERKETDFFEELTQVRVCVCVHVLFYIHAAISLGPMNDGHISGNIFVYYLSKSEYLANSGHYSFKHTKYLLKIKVFNKVKYNSTTESKCTGSISK